MQRTFRLGHKRIVAIGHVWARGSALGYRSALVANRFRLRGFNVGGFGFSLLTWP